MSTTPEPRIGEPVPPAAALAERPALIGAPMSREAKLARAMVELADTLVADFDVVEMLDRLTVRCLAVLEVDAAGIVLADAGGALRVMASSSETMRLLELFEVQSNEGPCFDCFQTGRPIINGDLSATGRTWPRFSPRAMAAGFGSVHALPMRLRGTVIGALNLFDVTPGRMSQTDVDIGQALADIATIAILQHRAVSEAQVINEQLNHALNSRVAIEQAKGMIAERNRMNPEAAFAMLRNHARNHNRRIAELADAIASGTMPVASLDRLPAEE